LTTDWQSIDTAPKTGQIWLFGTVQTWDGYERPNARVIGYYSGDKWYVSAMGGPREKTVVPTLWYPIPDNPVGQN
jgi:hypothetical protein